MQRFNIPSYYVPEEMPVPSGEHLQTIPHDTWQQGEASGILYLRDVNAGLVLAVHDPESGRGLLGHFDRTLLRSQGRAIGQTEFDEALEASFRLGGNPLDMTYWLGGHPHSSRVELVGDDNERMLPFRHPTAIVRYCTGLVEGSLDTQWTPPNRLTDVTLDCRLGALSIMYRYLPDPAA